MITKRTIVLIGMIMLCGCSVDKRVAAPLPKTFLEDVDTSKKLERLPFDHAMVQGSVDWSAYEGVYVKPVRAMLPKDSWMTSVSQVITSSDDYIKEANLIADYCTEKLYSELQNRDGAGLSKRAAVASPKVAVVEMVLTEMEFSHPVARAAALAAPVPGTGVALGAMSDPHQAFALRITDGGSGKLLATAADRKFAPIRLVDFNKLTATSTNREICELWASEIADTLSKGELAEVNAKDWDWKPW